MNGRAEILNGSLDRARSRPWAFVELLKPELTGLSVLTALCAYYLASRGSVDFWAFFWTGVGTLLVGGGAGALNQYLERDYDALMRRTERRPLPSQRVTAMEALWFGILLSAGGVVLLTLRANPLTGFLSAMTIATYLFLYTPLKRTTPFATLVGAIPGALPPVMGWAAAQNEIGIPALVLFAILFFWQIPHFHSLAWIYRKDYARAGFKMLTVLDPRGTRTTQQILVCCIALIPASLGLSVFGVTGPVYSAGAILLGILFLICGMMFARSSGGMGLPATVRSNQYSRRMFSASLVYLPALMFLMTMSKL